MNSIGEINATIQNLKNVLATAGNNIQLINTITHQISELERAKQQQSVQQQPYIQQPIHQQYTQQPIQQPYIQQPIQQPYIQPTQQSPLIETVTENDGRYGKAAQSVPTVPYQPEVSNVVEEPLPLPGSEFKPYTPEGTEVVKSNFGTHFKYSLKGQEVSTHELKVEVLKEEALESSSEVNGMFINNLSRLELKKKALANKVDVLYTDELSESIFLLSKDAVSVVDGILNKTKSNYIQFYRSLANGYEIIMNNPTITSLDDRLIMIYLDNTITSYVNKMFRVYCKNTITITSIVEDFEGLLERSKQDDEETQYGIDIANTLDSIMNVVGNFNLRVERDEDAVVIDYSVYMHRQTVLITNKQFIKDILESFGESKEIEVLPSTELYTIIRKLHADINNKFSATNILDLILDNIRLTLVFNNNTNSMVISK